MPSMSPERQLKVSLSLSLGDSFQPSSSLAGSSSGPGQEVHLPGPLVAAVLEVSREGREDSALVHLDWGGRDIRRIEASTSSRLVWVKSGALWRRGYRRS